MREYFYRNKEKNPLYSAAVNNDKKYTALNLKDRRPIGTKIAIPDMLQQ